MLVTEQQPTDLVPAEKNLSESILTEEQRRVRFRQMLASRQSDQGKRLKEFLLAKRRHLRSRDEIPRRKRAEDTDLMCRYFNGDQYGYYDVAGVYNDDRQEGDFAYALAVLAGHVDQAFIQMLKVRPVYELEPDDTGDDTIGLVARMCDSIGPKELTRLVAQIAHSELYNLLLHGESVRIIGWEPDKVSPKKVRRPKITAMCMDCGKQATANDQECPECGSQQLAFNADGYDEVILGQNTLHIPHMLSVQRDMSAVEPDESTFVIEYSYMDKHVAEWKFQSQIESSNLPLPIEMQLRFDLERSSTQIDAIIGSARLAPPGREGGFGVGSAGSSAALMTKQPVETHYWDVEEYGAFMCTVDEALPKKLRDGRDRIPAGVLLGDFFPDGVKLLFVGDSVMMLEPYMKRRKMKTIRYGRIAGTNSGAGLKKLMPLQDAENDNFNLSQKIKHTVGHPFTVINGHYIDQLPGAGNILKISKPGLDDISKVARQWPGQTMQNDGASQVIEGAMQFIGGTNTVGGTGSVGAPDMRAAGTATGIAAMQEQAAARQSGPVDQRIEADKENIFQILENIQEFSTDEQLAELAKQWGPDVVEAFKNCNIRQQININIKPNTEMPRSMALNQANYIAFGQALGQILPVMDKFPWLMEFLGDMATSMGFPFKVGEGRNDRREAQFRLNIVTKIEEQVMGSGQITMPPDPSIPADPNMPPPQPVTIPIEQAQPFQIAAAIHAALAQQCAPLIAADDNNTELGQMPDDIGIPRIFLQNHKEFLDVYKDWLFGEQAKSASEAKMLVVIQLWLDHFKAQMSQQAIMAQLEGQMNAAINPQPPPPPDNTPTKEDEDAAADAQTERDRQSKEEDHLRNEEAKDNEHGRKVELQDQKAQQQAELAQTKAAQNGGAAQ